jgi:hypothetical protein
MEYEPCVYVHRSRGSKPGNQRNFHERYVSSNCTGEDGALGTSERDGNNGTLLDWDPSEDPLFVILAVYVDDITIAASNLAGVDFAKKAISKAFEIKDLGQARKIIGIELQKLDNGYFLHQQSYLRDILERFSMLEANGISTPMDQGTKLSPRQEGEPAKESSLYRQQIGALLFAGTCTRPDLCVAINICSRYVEDPCQRHYGAVKRIMRYVKHTLDYGLKYVHSSKPLTVSGFCDSDFAGDVLDSKSTSGFVIFVGACPVSWKATKQKAVSTSTVEAEYISACVACKEITWIRALVEEICGSPLPVKPVLRIDNTGARSLAQNDAMSEKTKHIRYTYHFVRECIREGVLDLEHVSTGANCADMMTKPLARVLLERHREAIHVVARPPAKEL